MLYSLSRMRFFSHVLDLLIVLLHSIVGIDDVSVSSTGSSCCFIKTSFLETIDTILQLGLSPVINSWLLCKYLMS